MTCRLAGARRSRDCLAVAFRRLWARAAATGADLWPARDDASSRADWLALGSALIHRSSGGERRRRARPAGSRPRVPEGEGCAVPTLRTLTSDETTGRAGQQRDGSRQDVAAGDSASLAAGLW